MKKQGKKWMLVAIALLALVTVALPLVGCKNDSVSETRGEIEQTPPAGGTETGGTETPPAGGTETGGNEDVPVKYTITFNTDGGSTVQSQPVESGKAATEPAEPTKNSYFFDGWYRDEQFTNKYDFNAQVTSSFPLYAKWLTEKEITPTTVSEVISKLSGEGPYTLVATGEWSADDLLAIRDALYENPTVKVNLDLSGVEELTTIGNSAFRGCSSLATVTFGVESQLKTIGQSAFEGCSSLTSITIPASVKTIERHAFQKCSLTSITIPASVETIGNYAFHGCSSLDTVTMEAATPPELGAYAFSDTSADLQILVPKGSETRYKSAWYSYKDKIPEPTS